VARYVPPARPSARLRWPAVFFTPPTFTIHPLQVITFSGYGFPVGGAVTVFYGPFKLTSSDCSVRSPVYIVCSSVQGYGYGYTATVYIGVSEVPSTKPLVLSYAPPIVGSVAVIAPGTFTTAGSAPSAILITGGNFGSQAADLQVIFGQLVGAGSFPAVVTSWTHTQIRVQAGPGCGQGIPVTVTVGGQTSAANPAAVISYPVPVIGSLALSALSQSPSLTTLNTRGGDAFMVNGTNFGGPNAITPLQVQYACGGLGQYVYTTTCTRDATNPHTYAACPTMAGVGAGCTLSATVCSATSALYDGTPVAYAPPIVTSVTGPGALRASTEGNQGACAQSCKVSSSVCWCHAPVSSWCARRSVTFHCAAIYIGGDMFGPVSVAGVATGIESVVYGPPASMQYAGMDCIVIADQPASIRWCVGLAGVEGVRMLGSTAAVTLFCAPLPFLQSVVTRHWPRACLPDQHRWTVEQCVLRQRLVRAAGHCLVCGGRIQHRRADHRHWQRQRRRRCRQQLREWSATRVGLTESATRESPVCFLLFRELLSLQGFNPALITAYYTDLMTDPRASDGVVPGTPYPGAQNYTPAYCSLIVAHRQLQCQLVAGAGTGLIWTIIVDGQPSAQPTTSYAPPSITSVVPQGSSTVSTDGGSVVTLYGQNVSAACVLTVHGTVACVA